MAALLAPRPADRCSRTDPRVLKAAVERRLSALMPAETHASDLGSAMRYALLAPGKRIRPILTVLAAWEVGTQDLRALDAGCALEMIHAASLILDDMPAMDDAPERRGQASTHLKYGEDVAMLSAITLLSQAFATVGQMPDVDSATRCTLVSILARAVGLEGLAGGQFRDLRPSNHRGVAVVEDVNGKKTGALFLAAADMAVAICGVDDFRAAPLRRCAAELGQAYQLLDDLLDSAKRVEVDRLEDAGKLTLLSLVGQDEARRKLSAHIKAALDPLQADGGLARYVRSLFLRDQTRSLAIR
jgi:geranylgeranyl diphosphate synthase, type II